MSQAVLFVILALLPPREVRDTGGCPVLLVSGTADSDSIAVTFRDMNKLPIRRLEFSCKLADARADKAHSTRCYEPNASFMPRNEYTLRYSYPGGARGPMLVTVKTVTFLDGHTWKPSKREACRVLKIQLPHDRKKSTQHSAVSQTNRAEPTDQFDAGSEDAESGILAGARSYERLRRTMERMVGVPERTEAAPYYFTYIDRITSNDITGVLESQIEETTAFLHGISEEKSLHRYAPGKWSIRETWSHVNDAERVFVGRAVWFARGFDTPLPSFEQEIAVAAAHADELPWARHVDEFRQIRLATVAFFRNLPADAWQRRGMASGNTFTVRALAYMVAGHAVHHVGILKERYLQPAAGQRRSAG